MPQVQQLSNILPAGGAGMQIPFDVKQRLLADQLAQQTAAAPKAPYTSRTAGLVSALTGGLGGLMEGMETQRVMQGNRDANARVIALAQAMQQQQPNGQAPAPPANSTLASPASTPASGDARDLAIRTIYGEAGGEPAQGQAAVAAVLKNRLASGQYGPDMQSVITAPKQFSLWNQGDPAGDMARKLDPSSPAYQKIGSIYDGVMSGQIADPTGGADHYYNPKAASPAWGPQLAQQNDVTIGNHRFVGKAAVPQAAAVAGNPAPGQQAAADPSQTAPDASLRQTIEAAAAPQGLNPDAPAPNATSVSSSTLPPGVTAAMMGSGTPLAAPASPYGAGPQPMAAPSPDDQSLRDALLAAQAQHDPDAAAALPPGALSGQADLGAGNVLPANPPLPPQNPQSPYGGPPQPMASPAATPPSAMADAMAGQSPAGATGLSTDHLPGFDNFDQNGDVTQSSTGGAGFTGDYADGLGSQINGNLPAPGYAAGGPAFDPQALATALSQPSSPAPFTPDPATMAKFDATQANGLPVGSSGASQPSSGAGQPSGPLPQLSTQNLAPAAPQPGSGAALPQTGPTPPARPAGIGLDPDAPAPGSIATSAPGLPASMQPQPMGLPGQGGGDPMSAQAFNRSQALAQALQGGGGAQPPQPTPAMLASAMQGGNGPATPSGPSTAPQGGAGPIAAPSTPQISGQGSGGLLGGLGNMLGMGGGQQSPSQSQSAPPPASGPMSVPAGDGPSQTVSGGQMAALGGLSPQFMTQAQRVLSDPYATPEMKNMVMQRLFPPVLPPEKLAAGEVLEGRRADGSYGELARNATKPEWTDGGNGTLYNKLDPTQTMPTPGGVKGDFDMTRNGVMYNKRTGAITPGGGDAYTQLSPAEVAAANFPAGTHVQRGPNGELSVVNPGPTADAANDMTKSLSAAYTKEPSDLIQNVGANQQKIRELNALSGALQRLQQNGGTTGIGTDELAHLQSAINTGANTLGITEPFDMQDKDVMRKINTQVAAAASKTMSTRGATNMDFAAFQKANPGLENNPEANVRMLGMLTQDAQRDVNLGQAYRDQVGQSLTNKTPINPTMFDQIRQTYDADPKNHIVDPLTGQDISASNRLPAAPPAPGQNGQPLPGGMPNPPTASAQPPATAVQAAGGQNGALAQAQAAIAKGAPRAAVLQRLQSMGINPQGL